MVKKISSKWDLSPLFKKDDPKQIEQELAHARQESYVFINKWKDTSNYLTEPKKLAEALKEYNTWLTKSGVDGKAGYYLSLRLAQEETNTKLKALEAKVRDSSRAIANDLEFFFNRLSKVSPTMKGKFLASAELKPYRHLLDSLFKNAKHILPEGEEKILTLKGAPAHGSWVDITANFISKEERELTDDKGIKKRRPFEEIMSLTSSRKFKVRAAAGQALNEILAKHAELAEHEINAILDNKKTNDLLRGFKRPDESRHINDDIESEVVDAMLKAVEERFDIAKRFHQLKAKALGVKKLKYYERNLPVGQIKDNYPYLEAVRLVQKTFGTLDKKFLSIFDQFLQNCQIDVYPQKGRSGGAFCAHDLITLPTYILLNHTNKLRDVLTLAHELGHGINNELIRESQPAIYFGTPMCTAEVASTFMEDFVLEELGKSASDKSRFALQMAKLQDDVSSIFRQVACYRFEQKLHQAFRQEGYLSHQRIGQLFQKEMQAYLGSAFTYNEGEQNWWVYWSHIRSFFYVYSYASGLLISKSMQAMVREDKNSINKVKEFLAAGTSDSPKNIFKKMGIDITNPAFWDKGLREVETLLKDTEKLYQKIDKKAIRA